jgi:DNA polymerase III epsilon subunit-like protein
MKLFFDTETTGKADMNSAPDAKHQPRIVELGAVLTDGVGDELAVLNLIIRPSDFEIPAEASLIHGITTSAAKKSGVPLFHALMVFASLARNADTYCGHNVEFDLFMLKGECLRMLVELPNRPSFCTMKTMKDIVQLPGPYGFKWPRLQEAYKFAFGKEFDAAHSAMADVRASKDLYFWMLTRPAPQPKPA